MRLFTTILLLFSLPCFSQVDTARLGEKLTFPINYSVLQNFDLDTALKLFYELSSQTSQTKAQASTLCGEVLSGEWTGEGLVNNWGEFPQTILKPNKRIVFRTDSIFFYRNDTLVRSTQYQLVRPAPNAVGDTQTLFELGDTKEKWQIVLYQSGEDVPWRGMATKTYLRFNKKPNCLCSRPEELYSQETSINANYY